MYNQKLVRDYVIRHDALQLGVRDRRIHHLCRKTMAFSVESHTVNPEDGVNSERRLDCRLFYLNDQLKSTAYALRELFRAVPPTDKMDDNDKSRYTRKRGVIPERDIEVLPFNALTKLMDLDSIKPKKKIKPPYSDVVVILGHSNVHYFGSLAISDILDALLYPKPPSFVAFLGCCGGNGRYGPLSRLSQLPEWQDTIFGFFQRRMYIDELCHTSLVLAVQYYLHLTPRGGDVSTIKRNINRAFSDAQRLDGRFCFKYDIAFRLNDKESQTAQILLNMAKYPAPTFTISTDEIPLSCWQLAIYHTFTCDKDGENYIRQFITDTKNELKLLPVQPVKRTNEEVKKLLIAKLNEKCKAALKHKKLYEIIELSCELQLLQVTEETFKLLRANNWDKVDHLQFFVAMLQGYWGKNDDRKLRECATRHLMKVMKQIWDTVNNLREYDLHIYRLCCVGYCLFSPEAHIMFADVHDKYNDTFGCLFLRTEFDPGNPKVITHVGYYANGMAVPPCLTRLSALPSCEDELPWVDVIDLCRKNIEFVELFNDNENRNHFSMHNYKGNRTGYSYSHDDLMMALKALKDSFFPTEAAREMDQQQRLMYLYCVKEFKNQYDKTLGYMKTFKFSNGISFDKFVEMRVIHDIDEIENSNIERTNLIKTHVMAWPMVCRCRFVFAYTDHYNRNEEAKLGLLYLTECHYGQDLIEKTPQSKGDMYNLQKNYLDSKKEEFIKIMYKNLDTGFQELHSKLVKHFEQKHLSTDSIPQNLVSLQDLLNRKDFHSNVLRKNWQVLLDEWLVNETKTMLFNKLEELAKCRRYSLELVENLQDVLAGMVQDSVTHAKEELTEQGVFPFMKVGKLRITKTCMLLK